MIKLKQFRGKSNIAEVSWRNQEDSVTGQMTEAEQIRSALITSRAKQNSPNCRPDSTPFTEAGPVSRRL